MLGNVFKYINNIPTYSPLANESVFTSAAPILKFAARGNHADTVRVSVRLACLPSAESGRTSVQPVLL